MRTPVSILLALLVAAPAAAQMPTPLQAEALVDNADPAKVAYLQAHIVAEGPVAGPFTFRFRQDFLRSKLILVGESHGSAAPHAFDLALLAHLNARAGIRDYLIEADPLQAARLNAYLDSGDPAMLAAVFDYWRDSFAQWGSRAYRDKIVGIRALNRRLAPGSRVRFHGVDAIQDWDGLARWLAESGTPVDRAALAGAKSRGDKARLALAALGETRAGDTLAEAIRATLATQAGGANREETIFRNYDRLVRGGPLGNRPAYGLWGMFHIAQQSLANSTEPFAARVRASDLPAARSVQSIALAALDSAVQVPAPLPGGTKRLRMTQFNADGPFVKMRGSATLRAASKPDHLRVFALADPGSPFARGQDFITIRTSLGQDFTPSDPALGTPDFVQYVGAFRGSDWAAPLEAEAP